MKKNVIDRCIIPLCKLNEITDKKIVIYGIGNCGLVLLEYINSDRFVFFFDKKITDEDIVKNDLPGYSFEKAMNIICHNPDEYVILIGSITYAVQMGLALTRKGLISGKDYFYIDYGYDVTTRNMINFNTDLWKRHNESENTSEILISLNPCSIYEPIYPFLLEQAYLVNALAEREKSLIKGFVPDDIIDSDDDIIFYPEIKDYYKSVNVADIFDISLNNIQEQESLNIFNSVKKQIADFRDWNNITIYDCEFGIEITRYYLRFGKLAFDPQNDYYMECLKESIDYIVFWKDYFDNHDVKGVLLIDGIYHEGIINILANRKGIPVYMLNLDNCARITPHFHLGKAFPYLKKIFDGLDENEKKEGIKWGKKQLKLLTEGSDEAVIPYRGKHKTVFRKINYEDIINNNENDDGQLKVVICPHSFDDDYMQNGSQICDNYFEWLRILGEESKDTNYLWFMKLHPGESDRGNNIIEQFVALYPHIKLLPLDTAPDTLVTSGFKYAFTISGSIGHEYPYMGINVINAGDNPHMSFDFNINPKSKEELIYFIHNLDKLDYKADLNELYQYYYIAYGKKDYIYRTIKPRDIIRLDKWCKDFDDWRYSPGYNENIVYKKYLDNFTEELHEQIKKNMFKALNIIDNWKWDKLNKNEFGEG